MTGVPNQRGLRAAAEDRARRHPADVEAALDRGERRFRRRLLLVRAGIVAVAVVVSLLAATASETPVTESRLLGELASTSDPADVDPSDEATPGETASVVLDPEQVTLDVGDQVTFGILEVSAEGDVTEFTGPASWSSSDESVLIVDNGTATALQPDEATITATTADGRTATASVEVSDVDPSPTFVPTPSDSVFQQPEELAPGSE